MGNLGITILANGHFVVSSQNWDDAENSRIDVGAVTWVHSELGLEGPVSRDNSLIGGSEQDFVGRGGLNTGVVALTNGHYVVGSVFWKPAGGNTTAVGAVTWCNGTTGQTGIVSTANSLTGSTTEDRIGMQVAALANGNYVAGSVSWDNPETLIPNAGAVAWGNGNGGLSGPIGSHNALIGTTADDNVGAEVDVLPDGNYLVRMPRWDLLSPPTVDVGAITWCNGLTGRIGPVTPENSLHGSTTQDQIGQIRPAQLPNGKFVVSCPSWDRPAPQPIANAGAVMLWEDDGQTVGPLTVANSLTGVSSGDLIGQGAPSITVLANGHFVVASQFWRNPATGAASAGAITWCDGNLGRPGQSVTPENSLTGSSANDWFARVVGLKNDNFVAFGPNWDSSSPPLPDVGAVVWCDGSIGRPNQTVSQSNALIGTSANDLLGDGGSVVALANGHYIVGSHVWDHPVRNIANIGAVLWCNGTTGRSGPIDPEQALIGTMADDRVGARGIFALTNGHYVVPTGNWNSSAGAVTWCDGFTGFAGEINPENSLIGNTARDSIGDVIRITPDGNYIAISELYTHNGIAGAGSVTYGLGIRGTRGQVSETNSVFGTTEGSIRGVHYDPIRSRIFVGRGSPSAILAFRPTPLGKFQSIDHSPNSIRLTLPLTPEQKAGIEYAGIIPPPNGWLDLGPVTIDGGLGIFIDTDASRLAQPSGFYRAYPR